MISEGFSRTPRQVRGLVDLVLVACGTLLLLIPQPSMAKAAGSVHFIELTGVIDPVSARYLMRHIDLAAEEKAHMVVVQLDTPGGLDISMREMVQKILSSRVPVVVWVSPSGARAASAGVFITYAAHVAVMAPGTNLGAAHPVDLGGGSDETASQKAVNDAAAYLQAIARQRGRNVEWAEKAVRESASIDAETAVAEGVVDFMAAEADLYQKLDGHQVAVDGVAMTLSTEQVSVEFHRMSVLERILHTAVRPEVAYMLLLLGFYGIIFEAYNPGIGAAGVLGAVALILGFYALSVLPTSWAGVALILLSVVFFLVDLHTAGLGVFTVGGSAALVVGSLLLFAGADPGLRLGLSTIAGALVASFLFFLLIMTAAIRARLQRPVSGAEGMVGLEGVARTDIAPEGQVQARGTLWRARTSGSAIPAGARVRVREVSGLVLTVDVVETTNGKGSGG